MSIGTMSIKNCEHGLTFRISIYWFTKETILINPCLPHTHFGSESNIINHTYSLFIFILYYLANLFLKSLNFNQIFFNIYHVYRFDLPKSQNGFMIFISCLFTPVFQNSVLNVRKLFRFYLKAYT